MCLLAPGGLVIERSAGCTEGLRWRVDQWQVRRQAATHKLRFRRYPSLDSLIIFSDILVIPAGATEFMPILSGLRAADSRAVFL